MFSKFIPHIISHIIAYFIDKDRNVVENIRTLRKDLISKKGKRK